MAESRSGLTEPTNGDPGAAPSEPSGSAPNKELRIVSRPRRGQIIAGAIIVLILIPIIRSMATNKAFGWSIVGHYFFASSIMKGILLTLELTAVSMAVALVFGIVIGIGRLSHNPVVAAVSWLYVWVFRSVPLLVQLIVWYNIAALYPRLRLGIPGVVTVANLNFNSLIGAFTAGVLGLGLHEAAYIGEIVRGGVMGVDRGQEEAGASLGLSPFKVLRIVILPQAVRTIIPALGNETINTIKASALVSVLTLSDLFYSVQKIYDVNYEVIPLLIVACIWYLIIVSILSIFQSMLERHYGRGFRVPTARRILLPRFRMPSLSSGR